MKRRRKQQLALILCTAFLLAGTAAATDLTPLDGMGPPPDGGGGGAPPGDAAPSEAAIVITDGQEVLDAEYDPGSTTNYHTVDNGVYTISGLTLTSNDYAFNGIVVTGPESRVRLEKSTIRLGAGAPVTDDDKGGSALSIDNGATVYISDSDLVVDGAARYVTANYNDGTLIVNDSHMESTGSNDNTAGVSEPFSNAALLISGTARANFSIGASKTYYFNSTCVAEGWAALSTDSAIGDGLDLYAYNTDGIAENGGYSTYADTNCRVWLYGSRMTAAEIGCIISKSGQIHAYNSRAAGEDLMAYNEGKTVDEDTRILAGRNAVMIHAPDMMGAGLWAADCGTFTAEDTTLKTTPELVSTKDYNDYGDAVGAYIDYVSGAVILVRSTSANIDLKNVTMESYNHTLIQTVLNADSMGNFLAPGDGDQVSPIAVTMTDMDVVGDIRHEDYQRRMTVDLENTTLSGTITSGTMDTWNRTWAKYGEVNWVVDDSFDTAYGVELTVGENATWNVTADSTLTSLTVQEGGKIHSTGDLTITLDGEELTPEPGVTYTGNIQVKGGYDPVWESTEETEEPAPIPEPESIEVSQSEPVPEPTPTPTPVQTESPHVPYGIVLGVLLGTAVLVAAVAVLVNRRQRK